MEIALDKGSKGSWWLIRPAEVVKVEGEVVMVRDKIRLTSSRLYNCKVACYTGAPIASRAQDKAEGTAHSAMLHPTVLERFEVARLPTCAPLSPRSLSLTARVLSIIVTDHARSLDRWTRKVSSWTRRVQLVRRDGRDVSTLYGRGGALTTRVLAGERTVVPVDARALPRAALAGRRRRGGAR
jgi:hypothetical protein